MSCRAFTLPLVFEALSCCQHVTGQDCKWRARTTNWSENQSRQIGDWGFERLGFPDGLDIRGVTAAENESIRIRPLIVFDPAAYTAITKNAPRLQVYP